MTGRYEVISFDCYGTLINWESGILGALRPLLASRESNPKDEEILKPYAELESNAESNEYIPYREILRTVVRGLGERFGFTLSIEEQDCIAESIGDWRSRSPMRWKRSVLSRKNSGWPLYPI